MRKICIVSQYFEPDVTGSVTRLKNLLIALLSFGYEITIVTTVPHYPNGKHSSKYKGSLKYVEQYSENIRLIRMNMLNLPHNNFINRLFNYIYFLIMSLIALPSIKKVDCIWVTSPNFFGNIAGIIYKMFKRVPLILNVDDFWPDVVQSLGMLNSKVIIKLADLLNNFAYKYCDYITPISPNIKQQIIKKYHINPEKIHVIEVGFNYKKFKESSHRMEKKLRTIKSDFKNFKVAYSGILGPAYDFNLILNAAKIIESKNKDIIFFIHGKGELENNIRIKINKYGLKNTHLIQEHFSEEDYYHFLATCHLLLLPMKQGVFANTAIPTKLFTYLMLDIPIISVKGGDVERILNESNAGIAIEPEPEKIAEIILKLYCCSNYYSSFVGNGSSYVRENFSVNKIKEKVKSLFENIF